MISQQALEEAVLTLLCFSVEQAPVLCQRIPDPYIFSTRSNQLIAKTAMDYIKQYGSAPLTSIDYLLEDEFKKGESGKLLAQTLDLLEKQKDSIQVEFVISELDKFLRIRILSTALQDGLTSLDRGDLDAAIESIYKQSVLPRDESEEILLQDPSQSLAFLDREETSDFISSGIAVLDNRGARPEKKTLSVMMAATSKGKSWWLIEVGASGLRHHHKVLHITCELSKEKTARRYIQNIFSLTKDQTTKVKIPQFTLSEGTTGIDFAELERQGVPQRAKEIGKRLREMRSYPPLLIKEFPTSSLTIEQLYLYLDTLKRKKGFVPDIIIIDYADLMKIDAAALRIDTGRLYRELRGLSMAKDAAVVTATQGNRESQDAKLVDLGMVSEDWSKAGTADLFLTYSQTPQEFRLGLARIFVAKNRDDSSRYLTLVSQCYQIGQFCIDSVPMNMDVVNEIERVGGGASEGKAATSGA